MVQDPYGILADDRINDEIDFSKINSKDDYKRLVKEYLNNPRGRNLLNKGDYVLDDMYENSKAKEKVEQKQLAAETEMKKALRRAQRFESRRPRRSRRADERVTSRRTSRASKKFVRRWMRHPNRMDVKSIDTRLRVARAERNRITRLDIRLKNYHVSLNKNGIKQYRNKKGQFTHNPYRRNR